jgi:hypothetical protein
MNSPHVRALLSAYLDGEVTPAERAQVEQHLVSCPECARILGTYEQFSGQIRQLSRPAPPTTLHRDVWTAIEARGHRAVWGPSLAGLLRIGAVLAIALLAIFAIWRFPRPPAPVVAAAQLRYPQPDQTGVGLNSQIVIEFDKALDPTQPASQVVAIEPQAPNDAIVRDWGDGGKLLLLDHANTGPDPQANSWQPNTLYTVTVLTGTRFIDGGRLDRAFSWRFTTGSFWYSPTPTRTPTTAPTTAPTDTPLPTAPPPPTLPPATAVAQQPTAAPPDTATPRPTQPPAPTSAPPTQTPAPTRAVPPPPATVTTGPRLSPTAEPTHTPRVSPTTTPAAPTATATRTAPATSTSTATPEPEPGSPTTTPTPQPAPPCLACPTYTPIVPPTAPVATATGTPNAARGCRYDAASAFAAIYDSKFAVRNALGCPVGTAKIPSSAVSQPFQSGMMFWNGDGKQIFVLDGSQLAWFEYPDTWVTGDPPGGSETPPAGLYAPVRGFGKIWREKPDVRTRLGWATAPEASVAAVMQPFERGTMLRADSAGVRVLYSNGALDVYETP